MDVALAAAVASSSGLGAFLAAVAHKWLEARFGKRVRLQQQRERHVSELAAEAYELSKLVAELCEPHEAVERVGASEVLARISKLPRRLGPLALAVDESTAERVEDALLEFQERLLLPLTTTEEVDYHALTRAAWRSLRAELRAAADFGSRWAQRNRSRQWGGLYRVIADRPSRLVPAVASEASPTSPESEQPSSDASSGPEEGSPPTGGELRSRPDSSPGAEAVEPG